MSLVVLVLAAAIYGFAAANSVAESGAGDGSGTISGYNITNIRYNLNSSTPSDIDSVEFDAVPLGAQGAPTTVKVELVNGSGNWYDCTTPGTNEDWECDTTSPQVTALDADNLRVIAVE
jgi:hypothetical protein